MLTIKLYEDKSIIMKYCKKYKRPFSEALYLYEARDGDQLLSSALFEVGGDQVQVLLYETSETEDHFLFDAVLRAGLNYAAENGIPNGHIPEEFRLHHQSLFSKINFPAQPVFGITNFFKKYKSCNMAG